MVNAIYSDSHANLINLLVQAKCGHFIGKARGIARSSSGCRIYVMLCKKALAYLALPTYGACYLIKPKVYSESFYNITMEFRL